jgi:hypothetical protein
MTIPLSKILLPLAVAAVFGQFSSAQLCHQISHVTGAPLTAEVETSHAEGAAPSLAEKIARNSNGSTYCATYDRDGKLLRVEIEDVPNNRALSFSVFRPPNDHDHTYRESTPEHGFLTRSLEEERQSLRKSYDCWTNEPDRQRDNHFTHLVPLGEKLGDGMTLFGLRVEMTDLDGEKHANESWQSDLGLTMTYTYMRPREGKYIHSVVTNLRREEPDPALFQIPKEYLSDPLLEANTIFIDNQTGSPEISGGAVRQLGSWKNGPHGKPLAVVNEKNTADLTATLSRIPVIDQKSTTSGVRLQVSLRDSPEPVFETTVRSTGSDHGDEFAAYRCMEELWNRLASTHVGRWPPAVFPQSKPAGSE